MSWYEELDKWAADYLPDMEYEKDAPLDRYTSFRIGGPARRMAFPRSGEAAVLLVSALLTAGYLLPITAGAFFPAEGQPPAAAKEASWRMTVPVMLLAVLLAVLGVCSFGYADMLLRLAGSLL